MVSLQRRQLLVYLGLGLVGASAATLAPGCQKISTAPALTSSKTSGSASQETAANLPIDKTLPEFQGISEWLNGSPLSIADLGGSVALIQFWTFSCINCQRTLPSVVKWHQQYAEQGLKVVGIHTPEFAFERESSNVQKALQQYEITYPVPLDNEFKTWKAYDNGYWPQLYLADRQGRVRYSHIGEGAYDETEQTIRQLLQEG
ncbi:MAG: thioredoxin family protein [Leptolyngbyaceae cyanobacterium CSU_1_4]|nr:thioredoxin family protein [Leptolyngbyaceae cyanobacterium CSU_1_4]